MPWQVRDVDKHKKGLTDKQKAIWVKVANKALAACLDKGKKKEGCEASAIRQASAVSAQVGEMDEEFGQGWKLDIDGKEVAITELVETYRLHKVEEDASDDAGEAFMAQFSEAELDAPSAAGATIRPAVVEAVPGVGRRAPLAVDIQLMAPGWGNSHPTKGGFYYPAEVLRRDVHVFEGVKMYATDHKPGEKSERTEVSVIEKCPTGFSDTGAPFARAMIFDPDFAEKTRNRADAGQLSTLECSILGAGPAKRGMRDGRKAKIVQGILEGYSVDWVTRAGAGGRALNLAEADKELTMDDIEPTEVEEAEVQTEEEAPVVEVELTEDGAETPEPAPELLSETEVKEVLDTSNLPNAAKERLAANEYQDKEAIEQAITAEVAYLKVLTGSGKPFGQGGGSAPDGPKRLSEAEKSERFADILKRHGVLAISGLVEKET